MKEQEGFICNVDIAMLFFRTCAMYKITSVEDRTALMRKIAARNRDRVQYTRDVDSFVKGKKVLKIERKK